MKTEDILPRGSKSFHVVERTGAGRVFETGNARFASRFAWFQVGGCASWQVEFSEPVLDLQVHARLEPEGR